MLTNSWNFVLRAPRGVFRDAWELGRRLRLGRKVLIATTRVEFSKRYAGSVLGVIWYPLYSALLLGMYCFIYMLIFKQRVADFGSYDYVLFVFSGLMPYLGFSDAIASTASSLKANIALVKNTVFPVEFIPVRNLLVSLAGLTVSMAILIVMIVPTRLAGWHLLYLPVPIAMLFLFTLPLAWVISALAVLIPDIIYGINLLLLLFMFLSPIAFQLDQVPAGAKWVVMANPLTYLIEAFRYALIGVRTLPMEIDAAFLALCALATLVAGSFFRRLLPLFSDYE